MLVLRHGQSEWNASGRWQGQADIELTDLGYEQARRAADKLGQFAAVASSDLQRARVTATIIAESLGLGLLDPDPRLRETDVGEWQGLTHDEIERDWPGHLAAHLRPPTFETDASIVTRFGSKPASRSTRRKARTECAIGSTEVGCGLTMTALPVARLAIIDGQAFQVAKVAQVKHTATPRGVARQVLSSAMRALPKLRSQRLRGVTARRACRA